MKQKTSVVRSCLVPLLASFIWGISFVAQKKADMIGAFLVNGLRSVIAVVFLLGLTLIFTKGDLKRLLSEREPENTKKLWLGGLLSGTFLFLAAFLQQQGMNLGVDAGKSGFLTAFYVVLVPVFGIFFGKKAHFTTWIAIALSLAGMYFLCIKGGFSIELRDLLIIGCSLFYALQIISLDFFSPHCESTKLSAVMFLTCAVLSLLSSLIFEDGRNTGEGLLQALPSILFLGIFSSGIAYTLQVVAQKSSTNPAVTTIFLSMESLFSCIAGAVLLSERMTLLQYLGCGLMFAAVILTVLMEALGAGKKKVN